MSVEESHAIMNRIKPILEEELMWFGYYEDEPIAFFIMLPEFNQIFKHVDGKLDWLGKLKFMYHKLMKTNHRAFGVIFGVIPEFQKRGRRVGYCAGVLEGLLAAQLPIHRPGIELDRGF